MSHSDPAPDGSHGPHVLVEDVWHPSLAPDDRHHLERALRLREGDALTVGDGVGHWRPCTLAAEPEPVDRVFVVAPPAVELGVAFALIKGGRPELVVQKLTELGVDLIIPFVAARSVVRWVDAKAERNTEKFRKVAREAVMQCRRPWLPKISTLQTFDEVVGRPGAALADRSGTPLERDTCLIIVGPEGGWDETERSTDLPRVQLAEPVLRAETAAIAAATLLTAKRAGVI